MPVSLAVLVATALVAGCAPAQKEDTVASPVISVTRPGGELPTGEMGPGRSTSYDRATDDHTIVAKYVAPVPAIWAAMLSTFNDRKVNLTLLDRAAGRMGDTSMVLMRQWNGQSMAAYLNCGSSMTGPRANDERIHAVLLAQMSRLRADTVAVAVHFSATSQPIASGNTGTFGQCSSTARAEEEVLRGITTRLKLGGM
ncbi:MAG: hypothetical protein JWM95_335 [Gemmatimonadetes bacterium]|nr:hypothetical protein [Gemmatimonadota bacterium]